MNREVINDRQAIALIILFIINGSILLPTGVEAGRDLWLAILLSIVFAGVMVVIYSGIVDSCPGKDLFEILESTFGKVIGKGIGLLYVWFSLQLASIVLRDFGEFFTLTVLPDTPMSIILIVLSIISLWVLKEGVEVLGRISDVLVKVVVGLIAGFILLLIEHANPENLKPFLYDGIKPVIRGAFGVFSFPFGELVVFIMILSSLQKNSSIYRTYLKGLGFGGLILLAVHTINLLVLGIDAYSSSYFPSFTLVRLVNIGEIIQRVELVGLFIILVGGFVKISVCMLAACKGTAKIFGFREYRFIVTPLILIMINLSYLSFKSIIELAAWSSKIWPYYAFLFEVIVPVIILVGTRIKQRVPEVIGGTTDE